MNALHGNKCTYLCQKVLTAMYITLQLSYSALGTNSSLTYYTTSPIILTSNQTCVIIIIRKMVSHGLPFS